MQTANYFDYAATAPLSPKIKEILTGNLESFHNPNATYKQAAALHSTIEKNRSSIQKMISPTPKEVIFTQSGSESNNLAVRGFIYKNIDTLTHMIIGAAEHPSILTIFTDPFMAKLLTQNEVKLDFLPVTSTGTYDLNKLRQLITEETDFVCLMAVNNEIGTYNDLAAIKACFPQKNPPFFYSDITQAFGKVADLNLDIPDSFGLSGHKLGCPKGMGLLAINRREAILPLMSGSDQQEFGLAPGTQNVLLSECLKAAILESSQEIVAHTTHVAKLKKLFIEVLEDNRVDFVLNAEEATSIPYIINIRFKHIKAQALLDRLNLLHGYAFSLGSACSEKSEKRDSILALMQLNDKEQRGSARISFSHTQTKEDVRTFARHLSESYQLLRSFSL